MGFFLVGFFFVLVLGFFVVLCMCGFGGCFLIVLALLLTCHIVAITLLVN